MRVDRPIVAHVLPDYNPFPPRFAAGTELRVEQVALRQQRYRPLVVCGWFPGEQASENVGGMEIRRIRVGRLYRRLFKKITRLDPYPYEARMWRAIQEARARIVHIHNEPKLLGGLRRRLGKSPLPTVVHVANEKPLPEHGPEIVTRWVACSRYIADWLAEANGVPASRIRVIYTGVDTRARQPHWSLPASERSRLRAAAGVSNPDAVVLVFAGRLVREKGVFELLDAFERLRVRFGPGVELLVAGNVRASDDPGNEKALYGRAATARMSAMPGVRWVGSLAPDRVHDFLLAGDVFVLPSLWDDPFPTAMLEAAAAGLPIVAGARGGITEFLSGCPDFEFATDSSDPRSLAESIAGFVESPSRRDGAGHWLRARVETEFDWRRVCGEFEDMYDELLGRP